jgi:hypothetical protein
MNVEIGAEANNSFSGSICFEFFGVVSFQYSYIYVGIPPSSFGSVKICDKINPFHSFAAVKIFDF